MQVRDRALLAKVFADNGPPMARVARHAGVSRQFVAMLVNGQKTTCSERVGHLIAEFLQVPVTDLFAPSESTTTRPNDQGGTTARRVASERLPGHAQPSRRRGKSGTAA